MPPPTPRIDKLLAANLAKARLAQADKPYFYTLVVKGGGTSGKLLVDRLKIKEPQILAAKKATGGSFVVNGVCYYNRQLSKVVFETSKTPLPTWAQLVKKLAREEAGLSIEPKFVLAARKIEAIKEPEEDEKDQAGEVKAPEPEEGDAEKAAQKGALEKWNLRFDTVKEKLEEHAKAGKPWAKELKLKLSEAGTIYRQGKSFQAVTMFNEVVEAIKKHMAQPAAASGPVAVSSGPAVKQAEPAGRSPDGKAQWQKALAETEPAYLQGLRTRPEDASRLRAVMGFAQSKAEKGDFPGALAALKSLRELLAKPPSTASAGKPSAAQIDPKRQSQATADSPKKAQPETATSTTGEPAEGQERLFSTTNAEAARLTWVKTRQAVRTGLEALERAIRQAIDGHNSDQEASDYYESGEIDRGIKGLYRILEKLDNRLITKLDEALKAEGEKRQALHTEAKAIIRYYRAFVELEPLMKTIDQNPFAKCSIRKEVDTALGVLESKL
jgi:hypothetical protein